MARVSAISVKLLTSGFSYRLKLSPQISFSSYSIQGRAIYSACLLSSPFLVQALTIKDLLNLLAGTCGPISLFMQ